jgi:hypothetical protein
MVKFDSIRTVHHTLRRALVLSLSAILLTFFSSLNNSPPSLVAQIVATRLVLPEFICSNPFPVRSFSTKRDLLFTMATTRDRFYDVTLLSIRTAHCRSRIVLGTDLDHQFHPHFARVIALTQTEVWRTPIPEGASTADMIRHPWIQSFLTDHLDEFDRVFMFDAFDCYFHQDPFEVLNFQAMGFFKEGWTIGDTEVNEEWTYRCFNHSVLASIRQFDVLCSGTIYGPPAEFLKFEAVLFDRDYWRHCNVDQPILNYIVHTGVLKSRGISYRLLSCTGPVLTLSNCSRNFTIVDGMKEVVKGDGVVPHVVHQWKAFPEFSELYVSRCNMTKCIRKLEQDLGISLNWTEPTRENY